MTVGPRDTWQYLICIRVVRFLTGSHVCPKSNVHAGVDVFVLSETGSSRSCSQESGIVRDLNPGVAGCGWAEASVDAGGCIRVDADTFECYKPTLSTQNYSHFVHWCHIKGNVHVDIHRWHLHSEDETHKCSMKPCVVCPK